MSAFQAKFFPGRQICSNMHTWCSVAMRKIWPTAACCTAACYSCKAVRKPNNVACGVQSSSREKVWGKVTTANTMTRFSSFLPPACTSQVKAYPKIYIEEDAHEGLSIACRNL